MIGIWINICMTLVLVLVPFIWWWNDAWHVRRLKSCGRIPSGTKLPPGHMGIPFFGEMYKFLWYFKIVRRPDDFINSKRTKYGEGEGLYRSHLFGSATIIAWSPAVSKHILQSGEEFVGGWHTADGAGLMGADSLICLKGEAHTRLRNFVTRAVNQPHALGGIALMVQPRLIAALQSWANKGTIVAYHEARKVTFENIGKMFVSFEPGPVLDTLDALFDGIMKGIRAFPIKFPGTQYHRALQCRKKALEIFGKELEKKRKGHDGVMNTNDLMDGMMRLKDDFGKHMSDSEVLDSIIGLVVAGYESTSLSMMWALYYLSKYPNVLQKLREENMSLSHNKHGELLTTNDISKLTYTNKVVEETLRMANIASTIFRTAIKDTIYKGYMIPKGWNVIVWVRYIHTDPENFENPMCFNPDRWNESAKPGSYQVFGGGSRICAGNMLARLQLAIFLHHLVTGYKWELINPNAKVSYLSHPKPVDGVEIAFSKL